MKLGELVDAIRRLEDAERDLEESRRVLRYGGNEATMRGKHETIERAEQWLNEVRNENLSEGAKS